VVVGIFAVLQPNDTTVVPIGRRRPWYRLMLYLLIIAFAFTTLSTYLHFRDVELRYTRLARAIALESAQRPEN